MIPVQDSASPAQEGPQLPEPSTSGVLSSMRNIVDSNWADEERDFNAQDEDGREGHLFLALREVAAFLGSQSF